MSGKERLKVGSRENHDLLSGAGEVGDHSGLVCDFAVGEVDIPKGAAFAGRQDTKDDRDRTGGTSAPSRACGCQCIGRCVVGCVGGRNGRIGVEGWGKSLSPHGLRVHAEQLVDSNDVTVRWGWDVGNEVPRFFVENQLVEQGHALVEKDGVVRQILDPETAAWSPRSNFLSHKMEVGSLKFETNPASVAKTLLPCTISLCGLRATGTAPPFTLGCREE